MQMAIFEKCKMALSANIVNKTLVYNFLFKSSRRIDKIIKVHIHNRDLIGNRDWVGYGNGKAEYFDMVDFPFPSIRFKENTNELLALREKEKGDWRKLTIEEKKILYRASFRQTFSEINAPTGEWKSIMGCVLFLVSLGLWLSIICRLFVAPPLPETFSEERRSYMLRSMLVNKDGFITGVSSKWDYELDDWKK